LISNEEIDRVYLDRQAFSVTTDTARNFNQIKGRRMEGYFKDGQISRLLVTGNGESLYFDMANDSTLRGMNKLLCASMDMFFLEGQIQKINYLVKPEGFFTPPHMLKEDEKKLEGFTWREEEKPSMAIINAWRMPKLRDKNQFNFFNEPDITLPSPEDEEIQKSLEEKVKSEHEN
jgi:hypothetical protein